MKHLNVVAVLVMALGFLLSYTGHNMATRKIERQRFILECVLSMEKAVPAEVADTPDIYAAARDWCEGRLDE